MIWELAAAWAALPFILPGPRAVVLALFRLIPSSDFWSRAAFSTLRIFGGFGIALILAGVSAFIALRYRFFRQMLDVPLQTIKACPVASFIILLLIAFKASNVSLLISFLVSFPLIYTNLYMGLTSLDPKLSELADVFGLDPQKRRLYVIGPQLLPYLKAAVMSALSFAWKSGVTAELIGSPRGSIGEKFYSAKVYLESEELLAWTVVIILLSLASEKVVLFLLRRIEKTWERWI